MRLAKMIATVGPASRSPEVMKALIEAGVDVFRLNFSHAQQYETLAETVRQIRELSASLNRTVAILGDLQGPKFRVGTFVDHEPISLTNGSLVRLAYDREPGDPEQINTPSQELLESLVEGSQILLDDGNLELTVVERVSPHKVVCRVEVGGLLKEKKGINVPGVKINIPAMTEKDREDARFALSVGVDWLALSFVQQAADVDELRQFLIDSGATETTIPGLVAKIEKPNALLDIDAILLTADAIMVARGDLGVELRPECVPVTQKLLIAKANEYEKPVITATQMLESMIQSPTPTRAEVSDVANAVIDGSDAVMLSAETAVGQYPVEAVKVMARIIIEAEKQLPIWHREDSRSRLMMEPDAIHGLEFHETIARTAALAAQRANADAIVVLSMSGRMATRVSKCKPHRPILALAPDARICRKMTLLWGVYPLLVSPVDNSDEMLHQAELAIARYNYLSTDAPIVFCAGKTPLPGLSNTLKLYRYGTATRQKMALETCNV